MPTSADEHSLPAVHALHVVDLVKRWNVEPTDLLAELGIGEEALALPEARLSIRDVERLIERARTLTGERALGIHLGMQMRVSAHGYLGFAAMSAATAREALDLAMRFAPTRTTALDLRLHVDGSVASFVLEERADFGAARDVVVTALLVGIWQIGNALTGQMLTGTADFSFAEPDYFAPYARVAKMRFGQPVNQLVFDASVLDLPLVMSDRVASRIAREQCERELDMRKPDAQLASRVRALVAREESGFRSLEEVAADVGVSPRTLKRRLALQGVAFSTLLEEEQRERALLLLRSPDATVEAVADRLGYSDVANFGRAFRRWTGMTPAAYRRADPRDRK